jgi:hypothetical protein
MIELTLLVGNNTKAQLDGTKVLKLRGGSLDDAPGAGTVITWEEPMVVKEDPEYVASAVQVELPVLRQLKLPVGKPVWFNGQLARGPVRLLSNETGAGARSAFVIGGKKQRVANTHEEVAVVIASANGDVQPIPTDNLLSLQTFSRIQEWFQPIPLWE